MTNGPNIYPLPKTEVARRMCSFFTNLTAADSWRQLFGADFNFPSHFGLNGVKKSVFQRESFWGKMLLPTKIFHFNCHLPLFNFNLTNMKRETKINMPNVWPSAEMFLVVKEILKRAMYYYFFLLGTMPNGTQHESYEVRAEKKTGVDKRKWKNIRQSSGENPKKKKKK